MEISGSSAAQSMEVISSQLAQGKQKQEGAAVQELLAAADTPLPQKASNPAGMGINIDIKV